jgi:hypothetical protein
MAELPFNIVARRIRDVNCVLRGERYFGSHTKVHVVCRFQAGRLILQDSDVKVTDSLGDRDPHALTLHLNLTILVHGLDVKNELDGLTTLQGVPLFPRWSQKSVGMLAMASFA